MTKCKCGKYKPKIHFYSVHLKGQPIKYFEKIYCSNCEETIEKREYSGKVKSTPISIFDPLNIKGGIDYIPTKEEIDSFIKLAEKFGVE